MLASEDEDSTVLNLKGVSEDNGLAFIEITWNLGVRNGLMKPSLPAEQLSVPTSAEDSC